MNTIVTKRWYKEPWPWILMTGPLIVIVAGIATAWLAVVSSDGLVTDDYYKQGLAVNQRLHRDHTAGELGLKGDLMVSGKALRLMLSSASEQQKLPDVLTVRIMHPTRSGQDQLVEMRMEAAGFYGGQLVDSLSGRWLITIEDPEGNWRLHGDWKVGDGEPLHLTGG